MKTTLRMFFSLFIVLPFVGVNDARGFETDLVGTTSSIGNGFTGGSHPEGSHFHSSNLPELPPGNPPIILPGSAEVGGFFGDEEIRGTSEFQLQGSADSATLSFDVLNLFDAGFSAEDTGVDGLFGQGRFEGFVDVFPYIADGTEAISDYEVSPITEFPILSIEVGPGLVMGGDSFSVDITQIYNDLVIDGETALGIRLQSSDGDPEAGAITFNDFKIELEQAAVPEPDAQLLAVLGVLALLGFRRRCTKG